MYAEAEYSSVRPHAHGGSEGDHIQALRAMGVDVPDDKPEFPHQLRYLYDIHRELRFSSITNGTNEDGSTKFSLMAGEPINSHDIALYSQSTGLDFERWEIKCIMSLDKIFDRAIQ